MNLGILAVTLIPLTGPNGQIIFLDKDKVATLREPRGDHGHFASGTKCLIFTIDGKNINVTETCDHVRQLLEKQK